MVQQVDRQQKSLAGRKGGKARWGRPPAADIDSEIYIARLERELAKFIASAPPLSPQQYDQLSVLFGTVANARQVAA